MWGIKPMTDQPPEARIGGYTRKERDALKAENAQLKAAVEYLLEEHGGSVNIRHIKEAPGYTTVVYCPWCGDEEPCRVGRRVAEILAAPVEEPRL
jgi:hypothetical protein